MWIQKANRFSGVGLRWLSSFQSLPEALVRNAASELLLESLETGVLQKAPYSSAAAASSHTAAIKQLRERTGAPMLDVKKVLSSCGWDQDAAFTELRKKGLAAASRKTSRTAAEGLVGVSHDAHSAVVIELNSETDFVARNPKFQALVRSIAEAARGVKGTKCSADGSTSLVVDDLEVEPGEGSCHNLEADLALTALLGRGRSLAGEAIRRTRDEHAWTVAVTCSFSLAQPEPSFPSSLVGGSGAVSVCPD